MDTILRSGIHFFYTYLQVMLTLSTAKDLVLLIRKNHVATPIFFDQAFSFTDTSGIKVMVGAEIQELTNCYLLTIKYDRQLLNLGLNATFQINSQSLLIYSSPVQLFVTRYETPESTIPEMKVINL